MSLKIQRFVCNPFQENCYVVSDDTREGVVIDCGAYYPEERKALLDYICKQNIRPLHLLATHGHVDHNFGNDTLFNEYGLKVELHALDEQLINSLDAQCRAFLGIPLGYDVPPTGLFFNDNFSLSFGNHSLRAIHTPGHTPGGVIFYCEDEQLAFSGDTLFRMGVGRTDFEGGSYADLRQSLRSLTQLVPEKTIMLPGHGPKTTLGEEKEFIMSL